MIIMREKKDERPYWQQVRGVCILAVILIHVLAEYTLNAESVSNGTLMLRQLVNFPVPVFIFLSGYFTKQEKVGNIKYYFMSRGGG